MFQKLKSMVKRPCLDAPKTHRPGRHIAAMHPCPTDTGGAIDRHGWKTVMLCELCGSCEDDRSHDRTSWRHGYLPQISGDVLNIELLCLLKWNSTFRLQLDRLSFTAHCWSWYFFDNWHVPLLEPVPQLNSQVWPCDQQVRWTWAIFTACSTQQSWDDLLEPHYPRQWSLKFLTNATMEHFCSILWRTEEKDEQKSSWLPFL